MGGAGEKGVRQGRRWMGVLEWGLHRPAHLLSQEELRGAEDRVGEWTAGATMILGMTLLNNAHH